MRGTGDRLEDNYIKPIARELAVALKAIHDGGIIHRDVKGESKYPAFDVKNTMSKSVRGERLIHAD